MVKRARRRSAVQARRVGGLVLSLALALTASPAVAVYQHPGRTEIVSFDTEGNPYRPYASPVGKSVSADGRYVAFEFWGRWVLVRDRIQRTTEDATATYDGGTLDGDSRLPMLSSDGRYIGFTSEASNLVPGDDNGVSDAFVRDRLLQRTERVAFSSSGQFANAGSSLGGLSADARYVLFASRATNLVPGATNGKVQLYVRDRLLGTTELVSRSSAGTPGDDDAGFGRSISVNGRYVAFTSGASNLVPGGDAGGVFFHDRETGLTERVSVTPDGRAPGCALLVTPVIQLFPTGYNAGVAVSSDGRFVAFQYCGGHLVSGEPHPLLIGQQIYVRDRLTGTTELASITSDATLTGSCLGVSMSSDGRYVGFSCNGFPNPWGQSYGYGYIRDRLLGITELATAPDLGIEELPTGGGAPELSESGRYAAFAGADGFAQQRTGMSNIYLRDRGADVGVLPGLSAVPSGDRIEVAGAATFSGQVLTQATHTALVPGLPAGTDITLAQVMVRPEQEDLAVRIRVSRLPPHAAGTPGLVYVLSFTSGGVRYEIRGVRSSVSDLPPASPFTALDPGSFALMRCDPVCLEEARLEGSFAFTGPEAFVSIPRSLLPAAGDLRQVRAFVGAGELAAATPVGIDEVALPDAQIASPRVQVGIAPEGSSEEEVSYSVDVEPVKGAFTASLPRPGAGAWRVWARACLATCTAGTSVGVAL